METKILFVSICLSSCIWGTKALKTHLAKTISMVMGSMVAASCGSCGMSCLQQQELQDWWENLQNTEIFKPLNLLTTSYWGAGLQDHDPKHKAKTTKIWTWLNISTETYKMLCSDGSNPNPNPERASEDPQKKKSFPKQLLSLKRHTDEHLRL